jgi:CO/xanthine dehydrogenase FAD-binding subunit
MLTIKEYARPRTLEEAYDLLKEGRRNELLGGCTFLRLSSREIQTAVDLSDLGLRFIAEAGGFLEIGAMTTLRDLEISGLMCSFADGVLPQSVKNIVGTQFRNLATAGATVYSRYGFSDFLTALLVLDADAVLFRGGRVPLEEFLRVGAKTDILEKLVIRKRPTRAAFLDFRNSCGDFAVVNTAVSCSEGRWRVAVGARPSRARASAAAAAFLEQNPPGPETAGQAARLAVEELTFGTNMRGTAEYRKTVARVLLRRGILEVMT